MDRMFEDFLGRRLRPFWPERWWPAASMKITTPSVDLYEEKDDIVVKAELPGMEKDNIEVNLSDNRLTIKGEKKQEEEVKKEGYYKIGALVWLFRPYPGATTESANRQSQSCFQERDLRDPLAQDRGGEEKGDYSQGRLSGLAWRREQG